MATVVATPAPCGDAAPTADGWTCMACDDAPVELCWELKNRKKLEPTSTALPAASTSSITFDELMPLVPSAVGAGIIPAPYLARAQWAALADSADPPSAQVKALLRAAYETVLAKLPKKTRSLLRA